MMNDNVYSDSKPALMVGMNDAESVSNNPHWNSSEQLSMKALVKRRSRVTASSNTEKIIRDSRDLAALIPSMRLSPLRRVIYARPP